MILGVDRKHPYVVGYKEQSRGVPDLSSVFVVSVAESELERGNFPGGVKLYLEGDYLFMRSEFLERDKFDPERSKLSRDQANLLRRHLTQNLRVRGLEGDL
jgi:hypothetical protein